MRLVRDTPQQNGIPEILWDLEGVKPMQPIRAVYFLFLNEQIVYVGQSGNLHSRIAHHRSEGLKAFNRVFYKEIPADIDILAIEKHFILKFRPKYNYETTAKTCEPPTTMEDAEYYLKQVENPGSKQVKYISLSNEH